MQKVQKNTKLPEGYECTKGKHAKNSSRAKNAKIAIIAKSAKNAEKGMNEKEAGKRRQQYSSLQDRRLTCVNESC